MGKTFWKRWYMVMMYCIIGFLLLIAIITNSGTNNLSSSSSSSKSVSVGEEGKLYLKDSTVVPVCTTEAYLDALVDSAVANDEIGYREMLSNGKCYTASTLDDYDNPSATYGDVLVLKNTFGAVNFRFVNSNSLHYGETAWTNYEYVVPLN